MLLRKPDAHEMVTKPQGSRADGGDVEVVCDVSDNQGGNGKMSVLPFGKHCTLVVPMESGVNKFS